MKKTGFTLIELLAVIVILAVIALIATPITLNVINESKDSTLIISAEGYIKGVLNEVYAVNMGATDFFTPTTCEVTETGNLDCYGYNKEIEIDINKQKPIKGHINFINGNISKAVLVYDDKNTIIHKESSQLVLVPTQKSFEEDTWETIIANAKHGNIDVYEQNLIENVNNTKTITLTSNDDATGNKDGIKTGEYLVRIANTTTPEQCNDEGFSQTACGFVIEFVDIITKARIKAPETYNDIYYNRGTNIGSWPASEIRNYIGGYTNDKNNFVEGTLYKTFPLILKNAILDTYVVSGHGTVDVGSREDDNFESIDKVYLLSSTEVWGIDSDVKDSALDKTRQLDFYSRQNVTINGSLSASKAFEGNNEIWWLRSPNPTTDSYYYDVKPDGQWFNNAAYLKYGIAPAFRLG